MPGVPSEGLVGTAVASLPGQARLVGSGEIGGETLALWLLDVGTTAEADLDASILDESERRRAAALEAPGLRRRYLLSHVALRHLLGQALGLPPRDVHLVREPCPRCGAAGRPVLSQPPGALHFSTSSSEHLVLIGLASAAVGVDVEAVRPLQAVGAASAVFHPTEREELLSMAPEVRRARFTVLWCRKEAHLKGVGVGMSHGLMGEYWGARSPAAPRGWTLLDVPVPAGFSASAAVRTG